MLGAGESLMQWAPPGPAAHNTHWRSEWEVCYLKMQAIVSWKRFILTTKHEDKM